MYGFQIFCVVCEAKKRFYIPTVPLHSLHTVCMRVRIIHRLSPSQSDTVSLLQACIQQIHTYPLHFLDHMRILFPQVHDPLNGIRTLVVYFFSCLSLRTPVCALIRCRSSLCAQLLNGLEQFSKCAIPACQHVTVEAWYGKDEHHVDVYPQLPRSRVQ